MRYLVGLAMMTLCLTSISAQLSFTKIADSSTIAPGGATPFDVFSAPALSGSNLAFFAYSNGFSTQGIYTSFGSLAVAANTSTSIPSGTGAYTLFGQKVGLSGQNIAFYGEGNTAQQGIYSKLGAGSITKVADKNTLIPGDVVNYGGFGQFPTAAGTSVLFNGSTTSFGERGVYSNATGSLAVIADKNTAIPSGSGTFGGNITSKVSPKSQDGSTTAIVLSNGAGTQSGIYSGPNPGSLSRIADLTTSIPSGTGNFIAFSTVAIDGSNIAFNATGNSSQLGIYLFSGSLVRIMDNSMAAPGGGIFQSPGSVSVSGSDVAFSSTTSLLSNGGVYGRIGGSLIKILVQNDSFDGKTVSNVIMGEDGFSGTDLALAVNFTDNSHGVYVIHFAAVPEPTTWAMIIVCGAGAGIAVVRRRRQLQAMSEARVK